MEPNGFRVFPVTSKDVLHDFVLDYSQRLGWLPGEMDDELMWASGPGCYHVGELDGVRITGIAMVLLNDSYGYVSYYFCEEKHRGKGYAYKTWKTARAAISPKVNLALDSVLSAIPLYEREGFKKAWKLAQYIVDVSFILEAYKGIEAPSGVTVAPATTGVDFAKLKLYVEGVVGFTFARPELLHKWITLPTHMAVVATDTGSGDVVGFAAVRKIHRNDKTGTSGYNLGPLLADNAEIARTLLHILACKADPSQKFTIVFPGQEMNPACIQVKDEIKARSYIDLVRMYNGHKPPMKKEKCFAVFTDLLG